MMTVLSRLALAATLCLASIVPAAASPVGVWEIEMRDSRYDVRMCGDGTELCAELIWLGNGADSPENLPYLNTMLIDHARQVKPNQWKGTLNIYGQRADGTITQVGRNKVQIKGCVALVLCKTYMMYRYDD
jgi:uncharacterized protein (DUF2147 family)